MLGLRLYAYVYDDPCVAGLTLSLCLAFCFALMLMLTTTYEPGISSNRSELIRVGPALKISETGPILYFKTAKNKDLYAGATISSRVDLTSYRSHVISP